MADSLEEHFFSITGFLRKKGGPMLGIGFLCVITVICSIVYPYGMKFFTDDILLNKNMSLLKILLPVIFGSVFVELVMNYLVSYLMAKTSQEYIFEKKKN